MYCKTLVMLVAVLGLSACKQDPSQTTQTATAQPLVAEVPKIEEEVLPPKVDTIVAQAPVEEVAPKPKPKPVAPKPTTAKPTTAKAVEPSPKPAPAQPKIAFENTAIAFGTIEQGDIVNRSFHFRNTGTAPLTIIGADVTCGCTYPAYPFEPIAPGGTGSIDVTFNSKGKFGEQKPVVTLKTNAGVHKLYLEGRVNAELQAAQPAAPTSAPTSTPEPQK
jgi:outer membrane biosynthesis protein TonB